MRTETRKFNQKRKNCQQISFISKLLAYRMLPNIVSSLHIMHADMWSVTVWLVKNRNKNRFYRMRLQCGNVLVPVFICLKTNSVFLNISTINALSD